MAAVQTAPTATRFPYWLISALGIGQIVAWGSFYYVFVSVRTPMSAEFGWSKAHIDGALSVVLAVTGLCSYARGRWIDRYGGRGLMIAGAVAGAALLVLWSHIFQLWQLYAISVGIGVVSAMTQYEAAFAVVARMLGADYRRGIIVITLFGGLASTAFVPLTQFLGRAGYGALQGALMVPVYLAQAGSPLLAAWIWQLNRNYDLLEIVLLAAAATSAAAFVLAAHLRPTTAPPAPGAR